MAETPPDRPRLRGLLEPGALHPGFPETQPDSAWESEIEASKAISLRRIADALTGALEATGYASLEQLAWSLGRSFESGRRTDR